MWANMYIILLESRRDMPAPQIKTLSYATTIQRTLTLMLKVDLCANGAGAYAPYTPPLPTGLPDGSELLCSQNQWLARQLYIMDQGLV